MPTTFNASTATGAVVTADSSGVLVLQSDGVTALTANGANVTVAGSITAPSVGSVIPFYFANQAAFPVASTYHGAIAHSHSDGKMYFAHGGAWNALANSSDIPANIGTVTSVNLTAGTGVSVSGGPVTSSGAITVTNTAPDQVVSLTGAGTTTITGTYPSFTITSADSTVGTVTSVGGTGTINGITLTGTVTASGSLTLGGTLSGVNLTSQVTDTLPVANGGTGAATLTGYVKGTGTSAMTASAAIPVADVTGAAPLASPTFTGTSTFATTDALGPVRGNIVAVAALNIDCSAGNYFTKTIAANSTFTFSNVPASRAFAFTLELTHTSGTVTWPAAVNFSGGTAPTLTTGKTHLFTFVTDDGGTRFRAVVQKDYTN